jgi:hypothetical protein
MEKAQHPPAYGWQRILESGAHSALGTVGQQVSQKQGRALSPDDCTKVLDDLTIPQYQDPQKLQH